MEKCEICKGELSKERMIVTVMIEKKEEKGPHLCYCGEKCYISVYPGDKKYLKKGGEDGGISQD